MSKTWLITGSSRGLGRHLAEAVLEAGNNLVATARRTESLNDLVEKYGDRVRVVALDVTDPAAARAAVAATVEAFGRLDVLVNNAGYADVAAIEDMPEADFRAQIEANLFGVVNVTRAALPIMREQGAGHIIQISSVGGRVGVPGLGAYQAAKWAVGGFSEVLAKEVASFGIKITVAEPGGMRTNWAGSSMTTPAHQRPLQAGHRTSPCSGSGGERQAARRPGPNRPGPPGRHGGPGAAAASAARPTRWPSAQSVAENLAASDAKWRTVSESVSFDS